MVDQINDDFEIQDEPDQSNKRNNFIEDNSQNNLEDHVDDAILNDVTDKLPTENENTGRRNDSDKFNNSEEVESTQSLSGRSKNSEELQDDVVNNSELKNEENKDLDDESLFKLESDSFLMCSVILLDYLKSWKRKVFLCLIKKIP